MLKNILYLDNMKKATSVDEYIENAPEEIKGKLKELRDTIKEVAPEAQEKISYGMPYYGYKGRLAYFAYAKNHIGLYITPPIIQDHRKELEGYETATATVRFPIDKDLPLPLINKLLKARIALNELK